MSAFFVVTTHMSEPSRMPVTNIHPYSISTITLRTAPAPKRPADPYASPIIYTQPTTPDEYDTDTVRSYAMGARAGQYLALCIVKSAVARIDAEAGGGK